MEMIKTREFGDGEMDVLRTKHMRFFREAGARLLVPYRSRSDFYISSVTGSMGIAPVSGRLGAIYSDVRFGSKDFLETARAGLSVPPVPYCGESAEVFINSDRVGGWTYHIFSTAEEMARSPLHGVRKGYLVVPSRLMREMGVVRSSGAKNF